MNRGVKKSSLIAILFLIIGLIMNFSPCEMKPLPEIAGSADQRRILAVRPVHCVQSLKKRIYVKDSRLCILLTGEEGKHAAESGMDLKAYAEMVGKSQGTISEAMKAAEVHTKLIAQAIGLEALEYTIKREIGRAPQWLWVALGQAAMDGKWNKETTRERVKAVKDIAEPPVWADSEQIAVLLMEGAGRWVASSRAAQLPRCGKAGTAVLRGIRHR
ncbi:MAG: hypothetical protein KDK27_04640 [Leptospiraceae bacterium]|nr:hypothetical protein [Leptospiraceae bacterium]